ncbi:hypothetical protein [Bacillus bombysepticus]|uniref:hypothetical protein n=1 Tax=Bacillus bombysepticus TaxID=658666 RepID=UPI003018403A
MGFDLNLKSYNKLVRLYERNKQSTRKDSWFDTSEPIFKGHIVHTKEDFIKMIAFAYSWMPTIPRRSGDIDWDVVYPMLLRLQQGDLSVRYELLSILVPYINNSEVGTSKVLYFIAPDHVPIIDSRVLNTWLALFDKPYKLNKTASTTEAKIIRYMKYWDFLNVWIDNIDGITTIRELEEMIYGINGNIH